MGYKAQCVSQFDLLDEMLEQAVWAMWDNIVGNANGNGPVATEFAKNPKLTIPALRKKVLEADSITIESTDAQIDTAVANTDSISLMKTIYGLLP